MPDYFGHFREPLLNSPSVEVQSRLRSLVNTQAKTLEGWKRKKMLGEYAVLVVEVARPTGFVSGINREERALLVEGMMTQFWDEPDLKAELPLLGFNVAETAAILYLVDRWIELNTEYMDYEFYLESIEVGVPEPLAASLAGGHSD